MERLAGLALVMAIHISQSAAPSGRVSGMAIEEGTALPIAGARVVIASPDDSPVPGLPTEVLTDAKGRFVFEAIPPGRYRIGAHKEGFAAPMNDSVLPLVDVPANGEVGDVVVPMQRGGVIAGVVMEPSGRPMANAAVTALLKRLETFGSALRSDVPSPSAPAVGGPILLPLGGAQTNASGEFRIDGLPPGDYVVVARPESDPRDASAAVGTTYYPGTTDESAAEAVSVQGGAIRANIDVRLAFVPTFRVSGVVVDESGEPVVNAPVSLVADLRHDASLASLVIGIHRAVQADSSGVFVISGVPAGAYQLEGGAVGTGLDGVVRRIVIDDTGTPLAGNDPIDPPAAPGTIAITIADADVSDVKLVVKKQQ